ncbi:hypothetical protein BC835DRAFT_1311829, partial [Cytidiella melzeri]
MPSRALLHEEYKMSTARVAHSAFMAVEALQEPANSVVYVVTPGSWNAAAAEVRRRCEWVAIHPNFDDVSRYTAVVRRVQDTHRSCVSDHYYTTIRSCVSRTSEGVRIVTGKKQVQGWVRRGIPVGVKVDLMGPTMYDFLAREQSDVRYVNYHPQDDSARLNLLPPANPSLDRRLPLLWTYVGHHPLRPQLQQPTARTFVYFVNDSPGGKWRWEQITESLTIPHGQTENVMKSHFEWTKFEAGDCLFSRNYNSSGSAMDDLPMMWVGDPLARILLDNVEEMHKELNEARVPILGDEALRTVDEVAYETATWVKEVKLNGRCYSIGQTVERPRNSDAPAAASKIFNAEPSDMHRHQSRLLQ